MASLRSTAEFWTCGVRGLVRTGASGLAGLIVAESPCAVAYGLLAMLEDAPEGLAGKPGHRVGKKNAPLWAHHPARYSACLTRGLRPRGLSTSASAPPSRY